MKTRYIFTFLLFFALLSFSQGQIVTRVTDITAEQAGESINISYRMPESKSGAQYKVGISVSLDGGAPTTLQYVSGDIGPNVNGGKSRYKITWDALKQVSQIGTAEFFIVAEKVVTAPPISGTKPPLPYKNTATRKRKWLISADVMAGFENEILQPGFTLAYYKDWGAYITFNGYRFTAGPIYTINYPDNITLSIYFGGGVFYNDDINSDDPFNIGGEAGLITSFKWFTISGGTALDFQQGFPYFTAGLGVRF